MQTFGDEIDILLYTCLYSFHFPFPSITCRGWLLLIAFGVGVLCISDLRLIDTSV